MIIIICDRAVEFKSMNGNPHIVLFLVCVFRFRCFVLFSCLCMFVCVCLLVSMCEWERSVRSHADRSMNLFLGSTRDVMSLLCIRRLGADSFEPSNRLICSHIKEIRKCVECALETVARKKKKYL